MTNELFEKLKAMKSKEALSELLSNGVAELSVEDLDGVAGGSDEFDKDSQIKLIRSLMEIGNYDWAWACTKYYFGYTESEIETIVRKHGNVDGLLLVLQELS